MFGGRVYPSSLQHLPDIFSSSLLRYMFYYSPRLALPAPADRTVLACRLVGVAFKKFCAARAAFYHTRALFGQDRTGTRRDRRARRGGVNI